MFRKLRRPSVRKRRKLAQDIGTDPFEDLSGPWDGMDEMAEDFSWATAPIGTVNGY